jgi:hypothetical protein
MRNQEKLKEYMKMYREKNKEKIREKKKEYLEKNKEQSKLKSKEYREKNKEKIASDLETYRKNNKEKIESTHKIWYEKNKEDLKSKRLKNKEKITEYQKTYYQKIKERRKKYVCNNWDKICETHQKYKKNRRLNDPLFKLSGNISRNIKLGLKSKGLKKSSNTLTVLGCTFEEFKQHLENQFEPWMSWNNYGKYKKLEFNYGWDIDHIIPQSSAKTEDEILSLNHYSNLKPLCSYTNRHIKRNIF